MNSFLQSANIFKTIKDFRKPLIIVGVVAAVASAVFSGPYFIQPKFKSECILYPSNLIKYSEESPTEQLIQLLESTDIRDSIIKVFNLYTHYEVDSVENESHYTEMTKIYEQNVSVSKTEYESVNILVYDVDPNYAAAMIDSMLNYLNKKARLLQREKSYEVLAMAKRRMEVKKIEMDSMEALIQDYRNKFGLLEYKTQAQEYARAYGKALLSGSPRAISETKQMLLTLGEKGGEFNTLVEHLWRVRGVYNDLKQDYENSINDVTKVLTYVNVITHPIPADKKSSPIRWLIVAVSVSSSLFLAFLVLLFLDTQKSRVSIH